MRETGRLIFFNTLRRSRLCALLLLVFVSALLSTAATGCSPGYVMRAAYEQSKILLSREDIKSALENDEISPEYRHKLQLVLSARDFAQSIGLDPGGSFTKYADIGKDTLAWVVVAARQDSFSLHTWWFPIVGRVPYKGYFELEDAKAEAASLEKDGYEAFVRGTDAFSTLGWFNDPVLSTTLQGPRYRIANTVIHESVHSTVWIKGNVSFNESLANFVGNEGMVQFFAGLATSCGETDGSCAGASRVQSVQDKELAERDRAYQFELALLIDGLYAELDSLYQRADLTREQKLVMRAEVFSKWVDPFRIKHPDLRALQKINNAEIIQLKLYLSHLDLFQRLFLQVQQKWDVFMTCMKELATAVESDSKVDPFTRLRDRVGG